LYGLLLTVGHHVGVLAAGATAGGVQVEVRCHGWGGDVGGDVPPVVGQAGAEPGADDEAGGVGVAVGVVVAVGVGPLGVAVVVADAVGPLGVAVADDVAVGVPKCPGRVRELGTTAKAKYLTDRERTAKECRNKSHNLADCPNIDRREQCAGRTHRDDRSPAVHSSTSP
jgi:hypothetical protein